MTVAGMLQILFTGVCEQRTYDSIMETIKHFKESGFKDPVSILCDDKLVIDVAKKVFGKKNI